MFTGIVEEIGVVKEFRTGKNSMVTVKANDVLNDMKSGDSIALNGVCLTVTQIGRDSFKAEIMPETIKLTGMKGLRAGAKVNLERAMKFGDRLGGHLVSGHVDGVGQIVQIERKKNSKIFWISSTNEILELVAKKGSVVLDGVSLTVADKKSTKFSVSLVPYTLEQTILGGRKMRAYVNIEVDMMARYIKQKTEGGE